MLVPATLLAVDDFHAESAVLLAPDPTLVTLCCRVEYEDARAA